MPIMRLPVLIVVAAVATIPLVAAGADKKAADAPRDGEDAGRDGPDTIKPLGRTVRIQFKLVPDENPEQPLSILCATQNYGVRAKMEGNEGGFEFSVTGRLVPVTDDAGKLLMTFEVSLAMSGEGNSFIVNVQGSAVVTVGAAITLAELGERSLRVDISDPAKRPLLDRKPAEEVPARPEADKKDEIF